MTADLYEPPKVNVLGVGISIINIPVAVDIIDSWIRENRQHYVCVTGVHGVIEAQSDSSFRRILNESGLNTPDGMPMVWVGKLHRFRKIDRVYGPDLMLAACALAAAKGYRNFFYGGAEGVADELASKMKIKLPDFIVAGTYTPPFRPLTKKEDEEVIKFINSTKPDLLWVGLSTPKQEKWMAAHVGRVNAPAMLGVGAAFDFHTGRVKQAPKWIQRSGFEWLYRLCMEPKRLWKRYLGNNPRFLMKIFLQLTGLQTYPMKMK